VVKGEDGKIVARFKREGGLYVAELEFTDDGGERPEAGFARRGGKE